MRPRGGIIGATAQPAGSAINSAASGVWTLREAEALKRAGTWPSLAPGGVGAGLQLWLDASDATTLYGATTGGSLVASDGGVARWEDKSGNSRHYTQADSNSRPLRKVAAQNGRDAIDFNGTGHALTRAESVFSSRTALSWFAVVKNDDSAANTRIAFGERASGNDGGFLFGKISNTNIFYSRGSSSASARVDISEAAAFPTATMLASVVTTQSSGTAKRNGQSAGSSSTTLASVVYEAFSVLGNNATNNGRVGVNPWDGLICEFIIYDSALSDADRSAVENYLIAKWGIT